MTSPVDPVDGDFVDEPAEPPSPDVAPPPVDEPEPPPRPSFSPIHGPGPRLTLGYSHYRLVTQDGGAGVHAPSFEAFFPMHFIRFGFRMELGFRSPPGQRTEHIVRADAVLGVQNGIGSSRYVPYLVGFATGGGLIGTFGPGTLPYFHGIAGAGLEGGIDVRVAPPLLVGMGLAWTRISVGGLRDDLVVLRLRLGV